MMRFDPEDVYGDLKKARDLLESFDIRIEIAEPSYAGNIRLILPSSTSIFVYAGADGIVGLSVEDEQKGETTMGREIRRVPPGWEHPKDTNGSYIPMYDKTCDDAIEEWVQGYLAWKENPKADCPYWEWKGGPPDPDWYRPKFEQEPTHYQIYEDVSEGTPVSPVFASLEDMRAWLLENGYSEKATDKFIELGWAPYMFFIPGQGVSGIGIHSLDALPD